MRGFAVVLAGGSSRRFGRSKARLPWGPADEPLLLRAVRVACAAASIERVVVVVPANDPTLAAIVNDTEEDRVDVVVNVDAASGMASSIVAGVEHAAERGAAFVVLCAIDQPLVEARDLQALADPILAGAPASAAVYAGVVGIPAAFARASFSALVALEGDRGARRLLRDEPIPGLVHVSMPHAAIDVDTEAAYQQARLSTGREPG